MVKSSSSEITLGRVAALALVGLIVAASVETPGESRWLPPCPFYWAFGLFCPGCGSTRMMFHLVHGRVWLGFAQNPLAAIALPVLLVESAYALAGKSAGIVARVAKRHSTAICWVVVLFAVCRNIPVAPFIYLSPGGLVGGADSVSAPRVISARTLHRLHQVEERSAPQSLLPAR